jgi:ABC transport system ATP-binding/permease protein
MENVSKSYANKVLFKDINFGIEDNDRVGIVGINGTGKSTFLKIVAGMVETDSGKMHRVSGLQINYLPQNPVFYEGMTVLEQIFQGDSPVMKTIRGYEDTMFRISESPGDESLQKRMMEYSSMMDHHDAWNVEMQAKNILGKLGVNDMGRKVDELSGGQRKRVALAEALIRPCDLLILDEPTNHIDYDTIEWLEEYLRQRKGALLLITHDRYFLNRVTNRIVEIDKGELYSYDGNFEYFLEMKASREDMNARMDEKRKRLYQSELEWIRKGAKARTTKQKARIQRFEALEGGRKTSSEDEMEISVAYTRLGKKVVEFDHVSKSYGDLNVISDFTYVIKPTDRIGIIGPNGAGKSTLLNLIAGVIEPDKGKVDVGETVKIGYYTQNNEGMDYELRAIDYIRETAEFVETADGYKISAGQMLERFLFDSNHQYGIIRNLSGGERRRLLLAKVLMESPNVLLLDEPTNDLDIQTLEILEDYIDYFSGPVIVVSHDRYFLNKTADFLIAVSGDGGTSLHNDLEAYKESIAEMNQPQTEKKKEAQEDTRQRQGQNQKLKFSYNEKLEFEKIEGVIEVIESEISSIDALINESGSDFVKLQELARKQEDLKAELESKMDRWAYLTDLSERIENQK